MKRKRGCRGESPSKVEKMQLAYSIWEIWCIPFGNSLLKIHFSFMINIGYFQSYIIPPTFYFSDALSRTIKFWPLKRKMGVWGEIAPSKAKQMQFSNSIWCIPSANNLVKIQYSFKMKIFAIVMSIPPTFPLLFYDKILAISRLFLPPFLFWYLCQSYNKSSAKEEKKMGCLKKLKKIAIFKLNFRNLVYTFANILLKIHYSFPIKCCLFSSPTTFTCFDAFARTIISL